MEKRSTKIAFLILVFNLSISVSMAAPEIQLSGFLSAGSSYVDKRDVTINTTFEQFDEADSRLMDNVLGVQLSAFPYESLTATVQLVGKSAQNDFNIDASWAFINYKINPEYSFKVGKMVLPTFLVSDYLEIGYAYPWARPPMEMYLQVPMKEYNGIDISKIHNVSWWPFFEDAALRLQFFGGAIPEKQRSNTTVVGINTEDPNNLKLETDSTEILFSGTDVLGINLEVANSVLVTRIGYTEMELTYEDKPSAITAMAILDTQIQISNFLTTLLIDSVTSGAASAYLESIDATAETMTTEEFNTLLTQSFSLTDSFSSQSLIDGDNFFGKFWSIGMNLDKDGHVFIAELGERKVILANGKSTSKTWYFTYGFRFGELLPHITFAKTKSETEFNIVSGLAREFLEQVANNNSPEQESVTLGLRWDMNEFSALKVDLSQLNAQENNTGIFLRPPNEDVHIASIVLDIVF